MEENLKNHQNETTPGVASSSQKPISEFLDEAQNSREGAVRTLSRRMDWDGINGDVVIEGARLMLFSILPQNRGKINPMNRLRFFFLLTGGRARAHLNGMYLCVSGVWSRFTQLDLVTMEKFEATCEIAKSMLFALRMEVPTDIRLTAEHAHEWLSRAENINLPRDLTAKDLKRAGFEMSILCVHTDAVRADSGAVSIACLCAFLAIPRIPSPCVSFADSFLSLQFNVPSAQKERTHSENCYVEVGRFGVTTLGERARVFREIRKIPLAFGSPHLHTSVPNSFPIFARISR